MPPWLEKPNNSLRFAENLTLPTVIVMNANMGCNHCRQRVSRVISKMNGLLDYEVDLCKKEVVVTGAVDAKKWEASPGIPNRMSKKKIPCSLDLSRLRCFNVF